MEDSFGQLHVRGEHANLQYRINGVLLPEGITGFGAELDSRFVDRFSLIDGALPAQYGFKTAGIVDIQTKSGVINPGGEGAFTAAARRFVRARNMPGPRENWIITSVQVICGATLGSRTRRPAVMRFTMMTNHTRIPLPFLRDRSDQPVELGVRSHGDYQIPNNPGQAPGFTDKGLSTLIFWKSVEKLA